MWFSYKHTLIKYTQLTSYMYMTFLIRSTLKHSCSHLLRSTFVSDGRPALGRAARRALAAARSARQEASLPDLSCRDMRTANGRGAQRCLSSDSAAQLQYLSSAGMTNEKFKQSVPTGLTTTRHVNAGILYL